MDQVHVVPGQSTRGGTVAAGCGAGGWDCRGRPRASTSDRGAGSKSGGRPRPRPVWDKVAERVQALLTESAQWTREAALPAPDGSALMLFVPSQPSISVPRGSVLGASPRPPMPPLSPRSGVAAVAPSPP